MKPLAYLLAGLILLVFSSSRAEDDHVTFAKSLLAQDFDANLPAQPVQQWLIAVLPPGVTSEWGEHVTDCGEQTGDPAIDSKRGMPLCAEIKLKKQGVSVGHLMLFVGTQKKGKLKEGAALYFGNFQQDGKTIWLKKLGDLAQVKF